MKNQAEKGKWMNDRMANGCSFIYHKGFSGLNEFITCVETGETFYFEWDDETLYKHAAEKLWGLLDDIDTLTDVIKPTSLKGYAAFYSAAVKMAERRFLILTSDGYDLTITKTCAQKFKEENKNNIQQLNVSSGEEGETEAPPKTV